MKTTYTEYQYAAKIHQEGSQLDHPASLEHRYLYLLTAMTSPATLTLKWHKDGAHAMGPAIQP
jgi:hypothetical protein